MYLLTYCRNFDIIIMPFLITIKYMIEGYSGFGDIVVGRAFLCRGGSDCAVDVGVVGSSFLNRNGNDCGDGPLI